MPYLSRESKFYIDRGGEPRSPGELNYRLAKECLRFLKVNGPLTYFRINDVVGALECAKQEFYRRVAVPYEENKIAENGDVYPERAHVSVSAPWGQLDFEERGLGEYPPV